MRMKESGIAWVGSIPDNWRTIRIKHLKNGEENSFIDGDWIESPYITDKGIRYYTTGNIGDGYFKDQGNGYISEATFKELQCKYAYAGELVFSRLNAPYGRSCILPEKPEKCVLAVDNVILRTNENKKYICYVTQCFGYQDSVFDKAAGTTMKRISRTNLGNISIPLPPLHEQQAIAAYLDNRCFKINEIIAEEEKSIEEYQELKQAVIANAVLKGIDKEISIKNTGENWCQTIPSHWRFERGRYLFKETNERSVDGSEELLTVSQYTGITPRSMKNVTMFEATSLVDYKKCYVGDIAANTMWMWAGAVGVSKYFGIISPSYNTYRQRNCDYDSEYLDYLLRTVPLVSEYESLSTGIRASRLRLYPSQFLSIRYPVPPMAEQKAIVEYLDRKIGDMDTLLSEKQALIEELKAYKKSLIYEVVTGKRRIS